MNVALVYDRVNKWGGAERVLLALHEIWPYAPLFTAVYDAGRAGWARVFQVHPSFIQHIPFAKHSHEFFPWLTPMAFDTFAFDEFDAVISVTSAEAKGIRTKPQTVHICYCLTPTRYLWSGFSEYQENPGLGILSGVARLGHSALTPTLRRWDKIHAARPDYYIAISNRVKERIRQYYGRDAGVIYPPVDIPHISNYKLQITNYKLRSAGAKRGRKTDDYFLAVSRLVGYKRVDVIIEAFNELGWPVVIVGDGRQKDELRKMAGPNISFIHRHLTEEELASYYENCRGLVHAADEDFGIAAAEAQAFGKPVIAYRESGIAEIVQHGKTGLLFEEQNKHAMINALVQFRPGVFSPEACRANSLRFAKETFTAAFRRRAEELVGSYR